MEMDLFKERASVRKFKPDAVPEAVLDRLLAAAAEAPSGGNCQPWHFYVVRGATMKQRLCTAAWKQQFLVQAPLVIVVCAEPERSAARYHERGAELYCIQDTAAAIENILLCAVAQGLGTCWCGAFDEASVSEAMSLPHGRRPVAMLAVGYPRGKSAKPKRRPREEIVTLVD